MELYQRIEQILLQLRPVFHRETTIKNPAASGRGIEADLLPNPRFGLQALELRRRAAGNMSPTRFKWFVLLFWGAVLNTQPPALTRYLNALGLGDRAGDGIDLEAAFL